MPFLQLTVELPEKGKNDKLNNFEIIEFMINSGADINIQNNNKESPLFFLFRNENLLKSNRGSLIDKLLHHNVNFSIVNNTNETLLQYAFHYLSPDEILPIIKYGSFHFDEEVCYAFLGNKNLMPGIHFSSFFQICSFKRPNTY